MRVGFATSKEASERDREMAEFLAASKAAGHQAEVVVWDDGDDLSHLDVVVVRSVWNYIDRLEDFLAWARQFRVTDDSEGGPRLVNGESLIRWNCHKRYLLELERHGLPTVETHFVERLAPLLEYAQEHERVVVKPAVSGGAQGCSRAFGGDLLAIDSAYRAAAAVWPEVIVQPYLSSVEWFGEISLVVVDGDIVQGLQKSPASGEWRVQREYGGTVGDAEVEPEQRAIVADCTSYASERCGTRPLYMRVDLMVGDDRQWLVSEIELIEPVLYADLYPDVAYRLVDALARHVD